MISEDENNVLGEIAHICAASSEGPRFDSKMTDDERRSFNNLILLCDEHHKMIDNPDTIDKFPASVIKEWKSAHESVNKDTPVNENLSKSFVQNAEKIYNIENIDTANFS
ncbi:HNH endonuclease [Lutibacter citreus]|uniref:HNH endonuclease n=1 Tax=Lutibacter citreus TaxID=2138210 RepID=UPI001C55339A|nr:HNH endonuclease [Lutibacter citreus]